jgi:hypothetical protein
MLILQLKYEYRIYEVRLKNYRLNDVIEHH